MIGRKCPSHVCMRLLTASIGESDTVLKSCKPSDDRSLRLCLRPQAPHRTLFRAKRSEYRGDVVDLEWLMMPFFVEAVRASCVDGCSAPGPEVIVPRDWRPRLLAQGDFPMRLRCRLTVFVPKT